MGEWVNGEIVSTMGVWLSGGIVWVYGCMEDWCGCMICYSERRLVE